MVSLLLKGIYLIVVPLVKVARWIFESKQGSLLLAVGCIAVMLAIRSRMLPLINSLSGSLSFITPFHDWLVFINYAFPVNETLASVVTLSLLYFLCALYRYVTKWA